MKDKIQLTNKKSSQTLLLKHRVKIRKMKSKRIQSWKKINKTYQKSKRREVKWEDTLRKIKSKNNLQSKKDNLQEKNQNQEN